MNKKLNVATYLYEGYYETELAAAAHVFETQNIFTIACGRVDAVKGTDGRRMMVDRHVEDLTADDIDVLIIPGGEPEAIPEIVSLIQACESKGKLMGGICGGVDLLALSGVLNGRRFTRHGKPDATYELQPPASQMTDNNYESDRKVITAAFHAYLELGLALGLEAGVATEADVEGYAGWFKRPLKL